MIPEFPNFKHLEVTDRDDVMSYTSRFLPYSDFNFVSMWSWDVEGKIMLSYLHGNLIVKFSDYATGEPFLSFIGNQSAYETADALINYANETNIDSTLKLMPEEPIAEMQRQDINHRFNIAEDRDSFDYLLSVERMYGFPGNKLRGKRNFIKRCEKEYNPNVRILDLSSEKIKESLREVVRDWGREKAERGDVSNTREHDAISKLLYSSESIPNLITIGAYIDDVIEGFIIGEVLSDGYAMLHFEKARTSSRTGIYAYLLHSFAGALQEEGCVWINYEQDLGVPGLRKHKESLAPTLLKKYTLTS